MAGFYFSRSDRSPLLSGRRRLTKVAFFNFLFACMYIRYPIRAAVNKLFLVNDGLDFVPIIRLYSPVFRLAATHELQTIAAVTRSWRLCQELLFPRFPTSAKEPSFLGPSVPRPPFSSPFYPKVTATTQVLHPLRRTAWGAQSWSAKEELTSATEWSCFLLNGVRNISVAATPCKRLYGARRNSARRNGVNGNSVKGNDTYIL